MKIAFIGQKGIPSLSGGVERHVEEIATRMADQGHEVFVYVRNNYTDKNLKEYKNVKLIHLPSISTKRLDAISHTFLATIHALFQDYGIIHYQAIGPTSLSWIIKLFKRKTLLIATFHCQDYHHKKWDLFAQKYLRFGEYITCNVPDKTISVSNVLHDYALKKYGVDTIFIPNGAKVNFNSGNDILSKWGIKDKRYILSVSRLIKHKGVHYLIEAFKRLEDTNKVPNNFKLVVTGAGFYTDNYVEYLKTISQGRDNIVFTGNCLGEDLEQLFSHAYLFVQPSESEGLSLTLLEAMGHKLATLVSDIPENLEAIGRSGLSFKSKNVTDLENKLAYLLNKPGEVQDIGKLAKDRVDKEYSWDSVVQKTLQTYRDSALKKELKHHVWNSRKA
ncbi:spore coat protein SA [bacterium BMS3Abin15]|nr:spore coat protein SA [bacterium BMS3Abin15]HDH07600.1 glycosyltransferase [Candidatus Moranbacteria bacterium]HDZ85997.1 glycosyltransferase [Candidatus Moranbacteria bacterium]